MEYKPQHYKSPINLPECTVGRMSIKHRIVKERTPIIGMRQAFLRGMRPLSLMLKEPLVVHELIEEGHGIWMTDLPEELNQIGEMLFNVNPHGRVLVGGLGLGIVARTLAARTGVVDVVVVEKDRDVIDLCGDSSFRTVHDTIEDFLATTSSRFDFYLIDCWSATSEGCWWSSVMPLRRIIRNRWGQRPVIHCWAEDIMRAQLWRVLTGPNRVWYYQDLPPMDGRQAHSFINNVGSPTWEKKYGKIVDANIKRETRFSRKVEKFVEKHRQGASS